MTVFKKSNEMSSVHIRRMVISAMFLACALVIRTLFRMYIPIFGESGMRISVHQVFSIMPAILFGPVYGAIVAGLTDFIGHHLSPSGAFIPQLTLTSILAGYLRGFLWFFLKKKSVIMTRSTVIVFSIIIVIFGVSNAVRLSADGVTRNFYEPYIIGSHTNDAGTLVTELDTERIDISGMSAIGRMAVIRSMNANNPSNVLNEFIALMTMTMVLAGLFGLILSGIDWLAVRYYFKSNTDVNTMSLLLSVTIPAVIVNLINTEILRNVLPAWQLLPYSVIALPRVIQAAAAAVIITYFVAVFLEVLKRHTSFRELIK